MANHFRALGLRVDSETDLHELIPFVLERGVTQSGDLGEYVCWRSPEGSEIWVHLQHGEVVSIHPHFVGESVRRVSLIRRVRTQEDSELEGGFYGWADPSEDPKDGDYPFVFAVPDFRLFDTLVLPHICSAQISAFAHAFTAYPDETDFHHSQASREFQYATQSFLPTGVFETPERPFGTFTGQILAQTTRTNQLSGLSFTTLEVATLGGSITVVADPSLLDGPVQVGGVVQVSAWLSGRPHIANTI